MEIDPFEQNLEKEEKLRREQIIDEFENTFSGIPEEEEKRAKERLTEKSKQYIANYAQRLNKEIELYETSEIEYLESEIEFYKNIVSDFIGYGILDRPGTHGPYSIYYRNEASSELNDYLVAEYLYLKLGSKLFINRQQRKLDFLNKQKGQIWQTLNSTENEVTQHEPTPENGNLKPTTDNLTLKQQILLLDILGVLDLLKDLETTKKSELISNLISKNEQNVRNCLTYYHSSSNQNPLQNPANPKKILELLEKVGLTQYAEIAKEKLQKSLEEKKTNSEKTK